MTTRIVWGIFIQVLIFVCTVILAMTDSSGWPGVFFWITMISVIILNSKIKLFLQKFQNNSHLCVLNKLYVYFAIREYIGLKL